MEVPRLVRVLDGVADAGEQVQAGDALDVEAGVIAGRAAAARLALVERELNRFEEAEASFQEAEEFFVDFSYREMLKEIEEDLKHAVMTGSGFDTGMIGTNGGSEKQPLDRIEPEAVAFMSPKDMRRLSVWSGDFIRLTTRRGAVEVKVRSDRDVPENMVFMPFCYAEAAANLLTNPQLLQSGTPPN